MPSHDSIIETPFSQGREAAICLPRTISPREACPYEERGYERDMWMGGFASEAADMTFYLHEVHVVSMRIIRNRRG